MARIRIEIGPWDPEEMLGAPWHAFASRFDALPVYHGAAADLSEVSGRLAVFLREPESRYALEIRPVALHASRGGVMGNLVAARGCGLGRSLPCCSDLWVRA